MRPSEDVAAEKVQDAPTPTRTLVTSSNVILASGSPQRSEILTKLGIGFEVVVPGVEELTGGEPDFEVRENARRKAHAVGGRVLSRRGASSPSQAAGEEPLTTPPTRVIACDTDVVIDGRALGKPADEHEAREYLELLSGRPHEVLSGLVVLSEAGEKSGLERTTVVFKQLDEAAKERYVRFGEWRGRSGGYAIQTLGSTLVERLEGSVSNVVGLPVGLLAELAPELLERDSAA
jgi:septum formation protein